MLRWLIFAGLIFLTSCSMTGKQAGVMNREIIEKVADFEAVWTAVPERIPSGYSVDAPLMGNGDMGVCIGGPPKSLRFYLAKNDFWKLKSKFGQCGPRVFGYLDIRSDDLKGASYRVEQAIANGLTKGIFKRDGLAVEVKSWIAATENIMIVELSANGIAAMKVKLWPAKSAQSDSQ